MIEQQMNEERFDFITPENKRFIIEMTHALEKSGYTYNDTIGDGICWGKYMLIFRKANVKSKNVYARIYIREDGVAFRLFLNNITKHADFIANSPDYIKNVFIGNSGACHYCRGDECKFRKSFVIGGIQIDKCNGEVFNFYGVTVAQIPDYMALLHEFYPTRKK